MSSKSRQEISEEENLLNCRQTETQLLLSTTNQGLSFLPFSLLALTHECSLSHSCFSSNSSLHLCYVLLHHQQPLFLKWTESHFVSGSWQFQSITARNSSNRCVVLHLQMNSWSRSNLCKIWLFSVWWALLQFPAQIAHTVDRLIILHIRKVIIWSITCNSNTFLLIKKYFIQSYHFQV